MTRRISTVHANGFVQGLRFPRATIIRGAALISLVVAYFIFPSAHPDLNAINADDGEAYLALSYAMTHGLGYTRSLVPGLYIPHTTWPSGLPLLLAPIMAFAQFPFNWLLANL